MTKNSSRKVDAIRWRVVNSEIEGDLVYRASTAEIAAKKAFRDNKTISLIRIVHLDQPGEVLEFETSSFGFGLEGNSSFRSKISRNTMKTKSKLKSERRSPKTGLETSLDDVYIF